MTSNHRHSDALRSPLQPIPPPALPQGAVHFAAALDIGDQRTLVGDIARLIRVAPFFRPTMPRTGRPFAIEMTNCGAVGWVADKTGYRYQASHHTTGDPWPPIPQQLLEIWRRFSGYAATPDACLINLYTAGTRLGSHVDADEPNRDAPVVSVSLGLDAVFHVGGLRRGDAKTRITLASGDVFVLGGAARDRYHGIDRILTTGSDVVAPIAAPIGAGSCRLNLTMRRVSPG